MERDEIESTIRSAFGGVRLGSGISLRQAEAIDSYGAGLTEAEFAALPSSEITDDWTEVPRTELERDNVPHLDAEGLRYYLPALMLWLLDHYNDEGLILTDGPFMTAISTLQALTPMSHEDQAWRYDTFTDEQKAAIARFVEALPRLVYLDREDATTVARSLNRFWAPFLPRT